MFYCKECGDKRKWPEGITKSFGPCELCRKTRECSDVPSSHLPMLEPKRKKS